MTFFRQLQHLLPNGEAWRTTVSKKLRGFFEGLAMGFGDAKTFIDLVWWDIHPSTTRELETWEYQFGLPGIGSDATRRNDLDAAWSATGGQDPTYLQTVLQNAGFDVYVHEWWWSGPPYVAKDPRLYTIYPLIGTYQCAGHATPHTCEERYDVDGDIVAQPHCNRFLVNDPGYLVNKNLTPLAPPPVPDDPSKWPYFIYVGGETFPDRAFVDPDRRQEFERLMLKHFPTQHWIVYLLTDDPSEDPDDWFYFNGGDGFNDAVWKPYS